MKKFEICIIGLGYVGLPLAIEFSKKFKTIGYDIDLNRVSELKKYVDNSLETEISELKSTTVNDYSSFMKCDVGLYITANKDKISNSNFYIITVPTPIDKYNNPDLTFLKNASMLVGSFLKKNDIVVYESTVFPGATEEECVPVLELHSDLKLNHDFYVGYSPERISPGDKTKRLKDICKVTSGSNEYSSKIIDELYKTIISAGTYKASSIKVAEASKVIENAQRDVNISFVNEISKIFNLLEIDTNEVLDAAGSKWNFLNFRPGLVGGHCIGIDPFYLAQKAQELNFYPEIILAARRINDSMSSYICSRIIKLMISKNIKVKDSKALILGITFKENCPDIRNSKVFDLHNYLVDYGIKPTVFDPWVNQVQIKKEYNIKALTQEPNDRFDLIVLAVPHMQFQNLNIEKFKNEKTVVFDIKGYLKGKFNESL